MPKDLPIQFFLETASQDENLPLTHFTPIPNPYNRFAFKARRTIFTFDDAYGQMTSGPLIFYFSHHNDFDLAIEESRKMALQIEYLYGIPIEALSYTQDGSLGVYFSIPQHAFRKHLPGNFIPFVYEKMLLNIIPDSFSTAKFNIYTRGTLSTITSPGKRLPDRSLNFSLSSEEFFKKKPSEIIGGARAGNTSMTEEKDKELRKMDVARKNCSSIKLRELYHKCLSDLYSECVSGKRVLNISEETNPEFDQYLAKIFSECQLLAKNIKNSRPSLPVLELLFLVCRRFGDHGRQTLYMHNELYWPRGVLPFHSREWIGKTDSRNKAPTKCYILRRKGLCKRKPACGVLHPAELAHPEPERLVIPPPILYAGASRQPECEAAICRWLQRHGKRYVYSRDIGRNFTKTYTQATVDAATASITALQILTPVYPVYHRPRGRQSKGLFRVNCIHQEPWTTI